MAAQAHDVRLCHPVLLRWSPGVYCDFRHEVSAVFEPFALSQGHSDLCRPAADGHSTDQDLVTTSYLTDTHMYTESKASQMFSYMVRPWRV